MSEKAQSKTPTLTRRGILQCAAASAAGGWFASATRPAPANAASSTAEARSVPVIDITDLYHPPQDPGDNMDLIAAYALPEVDLRAVILDVTNRYRRSYINPEDPRFNDPAGSRDPGFIPVWQLNAIFGRSVPCAAAPYEAMKHPEDCMRDAPVFQQEGIRLLLDTLSASAGPVEVISFGSARPLAVAYNRAPGLLREKVRRVHLCAGASPPGFLEWNVQLDPHAFVRVLQSALPVAIYPCGAENSAFDLGIHNCYWLLKDLSLIRDIDPMLRRYLVYAFTRAQRVDFLAALEEEPPADAVEHVAQMPHNVWETAVWLELTGRKLARGADGRHRIVPPSSVGPDDEVISGGLMPCDVQARPDGQFDWRPVPESSRRWIYHRADPAAQEAALNEALPAWYASFRAPSLMG